MTWPPLPSPSLEEFGIGETGGSSHKKKRDKPLFGSFYKRLRRS
jgi:hypothetical protein